MALCHYLWALFQIHVYWIYLSLFFPSSFTLISYVTLSEYNSTHTYIKWPKDTLTKTDIQTHTHTHIQGERERKWEIVKRAIDHCFHVTVMASLHFTQYIRVNVAYFLYKWNAIKALLSFQMRIYKWHFYLIRMPRLADLSQKLCFLIVLYAVFFRWKMKD